ncbi:MAG: alpha-glucan family phosphorylase, partial [Candidatus Marinimicrobia bacterium]|nr:alpha-glucan family phosphorylase [Candidatus Neomarinimicrobiota bacterium]
EGCRHGENGWAIGNPEAPDDERDAEDLYRLLEEEILPTYYNRKDQWASLMRESIKTGVDFAAQRMIRDYQEKYY